MKKFFSLFVVALFTLSAMATQYCDFPTGHLGDANFGDANGRILLTLVPGASADSYRLTIKPNTANGCTAKLDYLYVIADGLQTYPTTFGNDDDGSELDEISVDLQFNAGRATTNMMLQWSTPNWGGRWQLNLDDLDLAGLQSCVAMPTIQLRGTLTDWNPGVTMTENGATASIALNLAAATTYEFKIYNSTDETWYGNNGTMTRENCSGWVFEQSAGNAQITTDEAGEYIFTWNYSENKLSVKYPSFDSPYCETEIGHLAANNADPNSFVLLSIGSDGAGHTIVNVKQDTEKNSVMFDYLQVSGHASSGVDVTTGGWAEMSCKFNTPTPDANGDITLEILWSTVGWPGRWMVQNIKVPADAPCAAAVEATGEGLWTIVGEVTGNWGSYQPLPYVANVTETGTRQYKIVNKTPAGDVWYGNNGTMLRSNCSGWNFTTAENNCNITFDFPGEYTFTLVNDNPQITVTYPNYTRTVTDGNYGTICLPYAATLEGATAYEIAGKTANSIVLNEVANLVAGVPYIFEATAGELVATLSGEAVAEAGSANGLVGSFEGTAVEAGKYVISNNTVKLCGEECTIAANRAYIDLDEVSAVTPAPEHRVIAIVEGTDVATALDASTGSVTVVEKMVVNGQLVIIKNGVRYNALGQVVK